MRIERALRGLIFTIVLLIGVVGSLHAQFRNRADNRGREFRLAFLHTNGADDAPLLAIVVAAERPTRGTITYVRSNRVVPISIPGNVATRFNLDTNELLLPDPARTPISNASLLLRFDDEVVVYGVNTQRWSSDAFLGLPEEVLGRDHVILSYPNTLDPSPTAAYTRASDFPSQFAVVSLYDGTRVTIEPTARLKSRPDESAFTVTLAAGEVYFGQALGKAGVDITGSRVSASRPVVVYGSHQRANIPFDDAVGRDHLVEQLPSVERWVQEALLTPLYQIEKTVPDANIARIVAAQNGTDIYIDSAFFRTLDARQMVEIPLDRAMLVTGTRPFLVAGYQHSTVDEKYVSQPNDSVGDPMMMLMTGPAQFDTSYWFESLATKDFSYHFINVVAPTERVNSLRLDGGNLNATFTRIPKTSYSYAQIRVFPGPHKITGRAPFGLYSYGYGVYNSYGYPGAYVFDTLFKDQKRPDIRWWDSCGGVVGSAFDDSTFDFGMEDLRLLEGSRNLLLERDRFVSGDDSIHFRLRLQDPYQDGWAELMAVDTAGLDRYYRFPVKGFTVAMEVGQTGPLTLDTLASLNGLEFCRDITLVNYGQFTQRITGLRFSVQGAGLRVEGEFPVDIPPGESYDFSVCFQHVGDTSLISEVMVDNGCERRSLAFLPLISGIDSIIPVAQPVFEQCDTDRLIRLLEDGALNSGISRITFEDSSNVDVAITPGLPAKEVQFHLKRRDPFQDMIYSVVIEDVVGNSTRIADTVGGLTLSVQDADADQLGFRVDVPWDYEHLIYGQEQCDTVYLRNYGLRPLSLRRPRILGNLDFSIPPDQLPITLQPGEVRPFVVCVRPRGFGEQLDTLIIDFYCGDPREMVLLRTVVDPIEGTGDDRCGNPIRFQVNGFVKRNFLQAPNPNPVPGDHASITFGLTGPQNASLGIYNGLGNEVRRLLDNDPMPGGIARIDAALDELPAGLYYLRLQTSTGSVLTEKMVISR